MKNVVSHEMAISRRVLLTGAIGVALAGTIMRPSLAGEPYVPASASLETLFEAQTWLNGTPKPTALSGKVVLVDVFTFDCINCKNITRNLRVLERTKRTDGVEIVGIHSPETAFERDRSTVVAHLREQGITWPVAIDNDFALWKAYHIEYWPTQLIFDRRGNLRKVVIGDSQDAQVDATIDALLKEPA